MGAVLCRGPRTVASVLRVMGLGGERRFEKYHRVLNRARWSGLQGAKMLLGLLIAILPQDWPLEIVADETIERRDGRRIKVRGRYRDAVRSTKGTVVKCYGLKWISLMRLVPLPWSTRPWALPFLTILAPSDRANKKAQRRHQTTVDWTMQAVQAISRWLGGRRWTLLGDGGYACVHLAHAGVARGGTLISRLRLDAQLYAFSDRNAPRRRGPKPLKGKRLPALKDRIAEALAYGKDLEIPWYGGTTRVVHVLSKVCLWYTQASHPWPFAGCSSSIRPGRWNRWRSSVPIGISRWRRSEVDPMSRQFLAEFKVVPLPQLVTGSKSCRHTPRLVFGSPRPDGGAGGCRIQSSGATPDRPHPPSHTPWGRPLHT